VNPITFSEIFRAGSETPDIYDNATRLPNDAFYYNNVLTKPFMSDYTGANETFPDFRDEISLSDFS
jgi:hypothetical protein